MKEAFLLDVKYCTISLKLTSIIYTANNDLPQCFREILLYWTLFALLVCLHCLCRYGFAFVL